MLTSNMAVCLALLSWVQSDVGELDMAQLIVQLGRLAAGSIDLQHVHSAPIGAATGQLVGQEGSILTVLDASQGHLHCQAPGSSQAVLVYVYVDNSAWETTGSCARTALPLWSACLLGHDVCCQRTSSGAAGQGQTHP